MTLDLLSDGTLALSQRTHVVPKCGRIFVQCGASRCSFGEAEEIATHWAESTLREKRTAADGQCQHSPAYMSWLGWCRETHGASCFRRRPSQSEGRYLSFTCLG